MFGLAHWKHLESLDEMLRSNQKLNQKVGFNCDVSLWAMSGIRPNMVRSKPQGPFSRIVHAHLSDLGCGRFGNLVPGSAKQKHFFNDWFSVIHDAYECPENQGRSSGFVSLELELAASLGQVIKGIQVARELMELPA
jgi:hypothetical protein